jgi:hypothetical protein
MKRYVILVIVLGALGWMVSALGRPRAVAPPTPARAADRPAHELALRVKDGVLEPAASAVPRDSRVLLRIENAGGMPVTIALAGYEDRLSPPTLAPGAVWRGEFAADRPGEDFAWLVDGQPAGRLAVTGSHLIEGHR